MKQGYSARTSKVVPFTSTVKPADKLSNRARWLVRLRNLLLFGCIIWALWTYFFIQVPSLKKLEHERLELTQQLTTIQQENKRLSQTVSNMNNDEYIEREARRQYNMLKPGDILFQSGQ